MKAFWLFILAFIFTSLGHASVSEFAVDKTEGYGPLLVTFDASGIKQAKKFIWNMGNGESVSTSNSILTYQYKVAGTYTASLSYQVNSSAKNPNYKEAGSVVIKVVVRCNKTSLF